MSEHGTGISWTHRPGTRGRTWNPTRGCSRVSAGCQRCYAETMAARIVRMGNGKPTAYDGLVRSFWDKGPPDDDGVEYDKREDRWTGKVVLDAAKLAAPLRWRAPSTVFVNSMSDLFHESLTNEQVAAVFGVMAACPKHTFIVLTKRARRMREWFDWVGAEATKIAPVDPSNPWWRVLVCLNAAGRALGHDIIRAGRATWPLRSVWLGVSVENQGAADERIPELLQTPAAVRLLSCEPLLGPLSLKCYSCGRPLLTHDHDGAPYCTRMWPSWVIAGCESGPGARPCDVEWLCSLRDQCAKAGVPFFLKQARETRDDGPDEDPRQVGYGGYGGYVWTVLVGEGSKRKPGGVIELPYLGGVQHRAFPEPR